jgi:hypothetical protein
MRLGETIATYDVGLALRGKSGRFEITSPAGDIYDVTCKPSHVISDFGLPGNGTDHAPFLVRRVAEGASLAETKAPLTEGIEEQGRSESSPRPFVLERTADEGLASNVGSMLLLYLEDDPRTGQPSACIGLKSELPGHAFENELLLTPRCATLNELDAEIRRLQAQLDEIRSRAKKMFYKAQEVAASA